MVKIFFELEQDEDGFPPVPVEGLNATPTKDGLYKIESIPFFVEGISLGDIVAAGEHEGQLWFDDVEQDAGHSTIQVLVFEPGQVEVLTQKLQERGCATAVSQLAVLVTVDIPPQVKWEPIREFLEEGEEEDYWTYKEAAFAHGE